MNQSQERPLDSHDFVGLSDGLCHYRFDGPEGGRVALLIHGATVPHWEFDRLVPYLTGAGWRTLRADLFGHGYSDRPRARYEHALFVRQMAELLDALAIQQPVCLIGHSLGAVVGARLAAHIPERVARLVLAAPLLDYVQNMPAMRVLQVPLLGELLMPIYVLPMLVRRRTLRYREIEDGRNVGMYQKQIEKPGFGRALLSLLRSGSLEDQTDCYRALEGHGHPVLLLRGAEDAIVTPQQMEGIRRLLPRAEYRDFEGTAHAFLLTHPERVAPTILDFLRSGN